MNDELKSFSAFELSAHLLGRFQFSNDEIAFLAVAIEEAAQLHGPVVSEKECMIELLKMHTTYFDKILNMRKALSKLVFRLSYFGEYGMRSFFVDELLVINGGLATGSFGLINRTNECGINKIFG